MRSVMAMFVGVVFLVFGVAVAAEAPQHGTIGRDVVEAGSHRDVAGVEAIAVDYEGYRYLFATEENAAAFRADPERFMVGAQGCCAKMGPLAGRGSTEIMVEHDGRLYLFASESCRNTFSQDPDKHIDRDDRVPATSPDRTAAGRALIARAIAAHLGDGGVDGVGVIEERFEEDVQHGDSTSRHVEVVTIAADGSVRKQSAWNESVYAYVATPTDAWAVSDDGTVEELHTEGRRELERRTRNTHWLSVLRAAMEPDALVAAIGPGKLLGGSQTIDRVVVSRDGTTCVVGIEPMTGRVKTIDYTGRGEDHRFGIRTRVFTAYLTVDGVVTPVAWSTYSGGRRESERSGVRTTINPAQAALGFVRPGG